MGKISLRGQIVHNRTIWLSELKLLLDIEDDRNCSNVLYKRCRGNELGNIWHYSCLNWSYRTLYMGKIPLRGQVVCKRTVWLSELKLLLDIEVDNCCNFLYKSYRELS
jgi:hypothetical protein